MQVFSYVEWQMRERLAPLLFELEEWLYQVRVRYPFYDLAVETASIQTKCPRPTKKITGVTFPGFAIRAL
jgi:hypothetical protein